MSVAGASRAGSLNRARTYLHERMQARRGEIEQAVLTRVYGVSDTSKISDPEYVDGLRAAVSAALDYGLAAIARGDERASPVPPALLVQARIAARTGINLDTVLRRYFAGYALLGDFLLEEAEQGGLLGGAELKRLLRVQAVLLDRLVEAVSQEHASEIESIAGDVGDQRAECIHRLLAGEPLDGSELDYDLSAHHLGAIATGPNAAEAIRDVAGVFDFRLLLLNRGERAVWVWLGSRHKIDPGRIERLAEQDWPEKVSLALGESSQGLAGWRLTHQQAQAALPIALRSPESVIRYSDVALLASMLRDDLLAISLRELYLAPLTAERDGGVVLRETLRAYFAAERNTSSAAASLGVSRRTVANRLHVIEDRIGRPIGTALTEIDVALRLDDLSAPPLPEDADEPD